jgi:hypothetical protein
MIEYFLLLLICLILIYSNFVYSHPKIELMIAYMGYEHPRLFERQYIQSNAGLFVFRNKAYNSINMEYKEKGTEQEFFAKSDYTMMLAVYKLHFDFNINVGIPTTYKHNNETVAEYTVKHTHIINREIFV